MDNLCGLDWYDLMWLFIMYELTDSDERPREPIPPLTGDDDECGQCKHSS